MKTFEENSTVSYGETKKIVPKEDERLKKTKVTASTHVKTLSGKDPRKKQERLKNKLKKVKAFLEIAALNDSLAEKKSREKEEVSTELETDASVSLSKDLSKMDKKSYQEREVEKPQCKKRKHSDGTAKQVTGICDPEAKSLPQETEKICMESKAETKEDRPRLNKEEYEKLKKQLAARKKALKNIPRLLLKPAGLEAKLSVEKSTRRPLFMRDVRNLIIYVLKEENKLSPHWCQLQQWKNITNIVAVVVEGITVQDYEEYSQVFKHVSDIFHDKVEVFTSTSYESTIVREITYILLPVFFNQEPKFGEMNDSIGQLNGGEMIQELQTIFCISKKKSSKDDEEPTSHPSDKFPRTQLLLTVSRMFKEDFPLPVSTKMKFQNFICTKDLYNEVHACSPMFSVDCEMCQTTTGLELTRICVVNEKLEVLYHTLVKPARKIIHYITRYSGITKSMMKNVTTSLKDVQIALRQLLPADAILIGQSLNCDLNALQMMHPYVIDTSVIFNIFTECNRKAKLSMLSKIFLNETIQEGIEGHSPIEDSIAAMKLVQLKLNNSIKYGDAILGGPVPTESEDTIKPCNSSKEKVEGRKRTKKLMAGETVLGTDSYKKNKIGKIGSLVGLQSVLDEYREFLPDMEKNKNLIKRVTSTNKAAVNDACDSAVTNNFTLLHLKLEDKVNRKETEQCRNVLKMVDDWINKLFSYLSINGFFLLLFHGSSNTDSSEPPENDVCFMKINQPSFVKSELGAIIHLK